MEFRSEQIIKKGIWTTVEAGLVHEDYVVRKSYNPEARERFYSEMKNHETLLSNGIVGYIPMLDADEKTRSIIYPYIIGELAQNKIMENSFEFMKTFSEALLEESMQLRDLDAPYSFVPEGIKQKNIPRHYSKYFFGLCQNNDSIKAYNILEKEKTNLVWTRYDPEASNSLFTDDWIVHMDYESMQIEDETYPFCYAAVHLALDGLNFDLRDISSIISESQVKKNYLEERIRSSLLEVTSYLLIEGADSGSSKEKNNKKELLNQIQHDALWLGI